MMTTRQALGLAVMALDDVAAQTPQVTEWREAWSVVRHMLEKERNPLTVLTATQISILQFVDGYIETNGYSPTYHEIREHFGWANNSTVAHHLRPLRRQGYITSRKGSPRSLKVLVGIV